MTRFEELKNMDIDTLAEWLDENGQFDGSPWIEWFDANYCKKCEPIMCSYPDSKLKFPYSWCELNDNKCKHFPYMDHTPGNKDMIKMWLKSSAED